MCSTRARIECRNFANYANVSTMRWNNLKTTWRCSMDNSDDVADRHEEPEWDDLVSDLGDDEVEDEDEDTDSEVEDDLADDEEE
jgi:hypothetical protein